MTLAVVAQRRMTLDEFLVWDDGTQRRYELIEGVPVMMAPANRRHRRIVINLAHILMGRLDPDSPFAVESEAGLIAPTIAQTWLEADVAVSDDPGIARQPMDRPVLIAEVLSPSTAQHDRVFKLPIYQSIPSVRDILLIRQDKASLEHHWRGAGERWQRHHVVGLEAAVPLTGLPITVPMALLYRNVTELDG